MSKESVTPGEPTGRSRLRHMLIGGVLGGLGGVLGWVIVRNLIH